MATDDTTAAPAGIAHDPLKGWNHLSTALARGVQRQLFYTHLIRRHALARFGYYNHRHGQVG